MTNFVGMDKKIFGNKRSGILEIIDREIYKEIEQIPEYLRV